jgi:disulfide oxidoreductase YuzD
VKKSDSNPEKIASGINISAAKNEFEPFQVIISKNYGNISISMDNFQILE